MFGVCGEKKRRSGVRWRVRGWREDNKGSDRMARWGREDIGSGQGDETRHGDVEQGMVMWNTPSDTRISTGSVAVMSCSATCLRPPPAAALARSLTPAYNFNTQRRGSHKSEDFKQFFISSCGSTWSDPSRTHKEQCACRHSKTLRRGRKVTRMALMQHDQTHTTPHKRYKKRGVYLE